MRRYESLDALRGLAALAVVIFHLGVFRFQPLWLEMIAQYGEVGVQFFFVISGFVISLSSQKYFDCPDNKHFLTLFKKRLLRIYPAFLFSLIISSFLAHTFDIKEFNIVDFIRVSTLNYMLIGGEPPQVVYWSLNPELQFYFLFVILSLPLLVEVKDYIILMIVLLSLAVMLGFVSNHVVNTTFIKHFYSFYFGIIAYDLTSGEFSKKRSIIKIGSIIIIFLLIGSSIFSGGYHYVASVLAFLLVLGLVNFDEYVSKLNFSLLRFLGKISYSLYLFHLPSFWILKRVFKGIDYASLLGWSLLVLGSLLLSVVFFYLFENPFLNSNRMKKALNL